MITGNSRNTHPGSAGPGRFRKSSYSGNNGGDCVEVAGGMTDPSGIQVQDTKNRGTALAFGPAAAASFRTALFSGAFASRA
jgi:hypothetical protein